MRVVRSAKVIVRDKDDYVLTLRRSDTHPFVPLTPDLPGGKVEHDENMIEGLRRELKEEIGLSVLPDELKKVDSATLPDYFGATHQLELYELRLDERPSITLDFEHDQFSWVQLKELEHVGKAYESLIGDYKKRTSI